MQRRKFLQSLSALIAAPALPGAVLGAVQTPSAVPKLTVAQQLWASYFATPKGQHAVVAVQQATQVSAAQAQRVVMRSVAQARSPMALITRGAVAGVPANLTKMPKVKPTAPSAPRLSFDTFPDALKILNDPIICTCDMHDTKPPSDNGQQNELAKGTPYEQT